MGKRIFGSIRRLPSGRFQASYLGADGVTRVNAPQTFPTKTDAAAWLATIEADRLRGTLRKPTGSNLTFGDYVQDWLTSRPKPLAASTLEGYQRTLRLHILPTFGRMLLTDITAAKVRTWHGKLGRDIGPGARVKAYILLHAVMATADVDELITAGNPCKIKAAGRIESAEPVPLDAVEVAQVKDGVPPHYSTMVLVAMYASLRFGELAGLRRMDINVADGSIRVETQLQRIDGKWQRVPVKTKAGKRTIHLPSSVMAALLLHVDVYAGTADDSLIFTMPSGTPIYQQTFNRVLKRAGGVELHSHVLRHSGLTLVAQNGATLKELMARGGHATPGVAMRYQHAAQQRDKELAQRLDAVFTGSR